MGYDLNSAIRLYYSVGINYIISLLKVLQSNDILFTIIRLIWAILAIAGGVGILAFLICWLVIPKAV